MHPTPPVRPPLRDGGTPPLPMGDDSPYDNARPPAHQPSRTIRLSVVVTIVDGGAALQRCLTALTTQADAPPLEIVVPFDATVPQMDDFQRRFPDVRFLALGELQTKRSPSSPAGQHELFDRRRTAGLEVASGDLIAILEDRGVPRPDWARTVARLHDAGYAVIGGAIENGADRWLNWAVYFCDFARYQLPFDASEAAYVSDVNICYKRRAIESTRAVWRERYHETSVHWALQRAGERLFLSPAPVVDEVRDGLNLATLLAERYHWGRLFAYTRARESGRARSLAYAALSPALPVLLFARLARHQWRKRRTMSRFLWAWPAVALLLAAWATGEMAGYVTGEP